MSEEIEEEEFFERRSVFRTFFERSPTAIFLVDIRDPARRTIVLCNEAAWRMYGYEQNGDLNQQPLITLYAEPCDFPAIISEARERSTVTREELHRKQDGTTFQVQCVYTVVKLGEIEYVTIFVQDITSRKRLEEAEGKFQAIFENSPDGIVIIAPQETTENYWPWIIEDCNREFCQMNGFDRSELIGKDIRTVSYETPFDDKQQAKSLEIQETKWPIIGDEAFRWQYYQKMKQGRIRRKEIHRRKDGTIFFIEGSTRLASFGGKEYVLGIDRDITEEEHLRRYFEDLRIDVGRTFHTFSSTLFQMQLALKPTIQALGPDPFRAGYSPTTGEIWRIIADPWNNLVNSLRKLIYEMGSGTRRDTFSAIEWHEWNDLFSQLEGLEDIDKVEFRVPVLQRASRQVIDYLCEIQQKHAIRKEIIREVKHNAEQLEHMACLVILKRVQEHVIDTDFLVKDIRERVLTGNRPEEEPEICELWSLVVEVQRSLAEYASYKGVTFKEEDRSNRALVKVVRPHITRALHNLLDNAIKYSWWKEVNVNPWIDIKCYALENKVYVEIEDYGVPIPEDEIEKELIFQIGYRGRLSGQRNRPGTGIGLFDARTMARRNGGDVRLISRPASRVAPSEELKVAHLVTAILYLPICNAEKKGGEA